MHSGGQKCVRKLAYLAWSVGLEREQTGKREIEVLLRNKSFQNRPHMFWVFTRTINEKITTPNFSLKHLKNKE